MKISVRISVDPSGRISNVTGMPFVADIFPRNHPRRVRHPAGGVLPEGNIGSQLKVLQGGVQVPADGVRVAGRPVRARRAVASDAGHWRRADVLAPRVDPAENRKREKLAEIN